MEELANQANQKTFRSYLMFWSGQLISLFGSMVVYFVIIWWITEETQSPMYLAIASFLFIICQVIVLPIAGVLADRLNRKVIILVADSLQAVATLILLVLFQLNLANIWIVFIFISIRSVFQAFHLPTVNSIIPIMVPKESLSRINGINFLFTGVVQIIAPLIGATLMIFLPINTILWVDLITFCIAVIPLILIKIPSVKNPKEMVEKNSFLKEFKLGIKTIKVIPGLITLIFYSMLLNFLLMPFNVLLPYIIEAPHIHAGSASDFAFVMVFFQVGMVLGALLTSVKKEWKHKIFTYFGSLVVCTGILSVLALAPNGFFLMMGIATFVLGFLLPIGNTIYMTIIQTVVPHDKMGRVISMDHSISALISPIGALIAGPLAEVIGVRIVFLLSSIIGVVATSYTWSRMKAKKVNYDDKAALVEVAEKINNINGEKDGSNTN